MAEMVRIGEKLGETPQESRQPMGPWCRLEKWRVAQGGVHHSDQQGPRPQRAGACAPGAEMPGAEAPLQHG